MCLSNILFQTFLIQYVDINIFFIFQILQLRPLQSVNQLQLNHQIIPITTHQTQQSRGYCGIVMASVHGNFSSLEISNLNNQRHAQRITWRLLRKKTRN